MAKLLKVNDVIEQCGLEGKDADLFRQVAINRLEALCHEAYGEEDPCTEAEFCDEYSVLLRRSSQEVREALGVYLRASLSEETLAPQIDQTSST